MTKPKKNKKSGPPRTKVQLRENVTSPVDDEASSALEFASSFEEGRISSPSTFSFLHCDATVLLPSCSPAVSFFDEDSLTLGSFDGKTNEKKNDQTMTNT
jgi:hypothetical protein